MRRFDGSDWLLMVLSAAGKKGLSPVQLQKSLFLVGRAQPRSRFYKFTPYHYGPFCAGIYRDAETAASGGLMSIAYTPDRKWPEYQLTPQGYEKARTLFRELPQEMRKYVEAVVDWVCRQTFSALIGAIYKRYPKFKKNSVFQE